MIQDSQSASAQGQDPGAPKWYLLKQVSILTSSGTIGDPVDIAIKDGTIAAIASQLIVAPGFRVIDGAKWTVTLGIVNTASNFGLPAATAAVNRGLRHPISSIRADFKVSENYLADETCVQYRRNGFSHAHILPGSGTISGQSSVVSLSPDSTNSASHIVSADVMMVAPLASDSQGGYPDSRMGHLALLRQTLTDAAEATQLGRLPNAGVSELIPVVNGKKQLVVRVSSDAEVEGVLRVVPQSISITFDVNGPINRAIAAIAKRNARVIYAVNQSDNIPNSNVRLTALRSLVSSYKVPARLVKAGIPFVLSTSAPDRFMANVRRCIANGLSIQDATKAIFETPRQWLKFETTVAVGSIANITAWTTNPLEKSSTTNPPALMFVAGRLVDNRSDQFVLQPIRPAAPLKPVPFIMFTTTDKAVPVGANVPVKDKFILRNATVWTSESEGILPNTDIRVENGKIVAIGSKLKASSGHEEIDCSNQHITAGLIDCHSHTAVVGSVNEGSNIITAECRIQDVINPDDINIYRQLAGGTTAANILHGSANAIGGQNAVVKWRWGSSTNDLLISSAPEGIKFALGENPTRSNSGRGGRYPATRMGVERIIRSAFQRAKDYRIAQAGSTKVRTDYQLEAIAEILEGKRLVHCHSYRSDEILAMIRVADSFGFTVATFQHVLEGYKVANEMATHGAGGSTFSDWWGYKIEAFDAIPGNAALMHQRGVVSSLNSDSSELARRLNLEAAKSVRDGNMPEEAALNLVTLNPAKQLKIDRFTGSIKVGKDADLVLWSDHPFHVSSVANKTWVDGKCLFDRSLDILERTELEAEELSLRTQLGVEKVTAVTGTLPIMLLKEPSVKNAPTKKTSSVAIKSAFIGATLHTGLGVVIPQGVLLTDEAGRIQYVGDRKTQIPNGYRKVDVSGRHIAPGFFDAISTVGVNEIGSRRETQDYAELASYSPELMLANSVNVDAETVAVARESGVLTVNITPVGGTLSGSASVIQLDGWTREDFTIRSQSAVALEFSSRTSALEYGHDHDMTSGSISVPPVEKIDTDLGEKLIGLDGFIAECRRYLVAKATSRQIPTDLRFEAFKPVLDRAIPLLVRVDEEGEILETLAFAKRHGLRVVLVGCRNADRILMHIKASGVGVLIAWPLVLPRYDDVAYDEQWRIPSKFAAAGIPFAITSSGTSDNTRWLPLAAGMAIPFGLSADAALASITSAPAQILGVDAEVGALEKGRRATFNVLSGGPLEPTTQVIGSYISGAPVVASSRQFHLKQKWERRPTP